MRVREAYRGITHSVCRACYGEDHDSVTLGPITDSRDSEPCEFCGADPANANRACLCGNPLDESADGDRCGECARQELENAAFDAGEVL